MAATAFVILFAVAFPSSSVSYSSFQPFQRLRTQSYASTQKLSSSVSETANDVLKATGSSGVELLKDYLNSKDAALFTKKLVLLDKKIATEAEKLNFWTGESFSIKSCVCTGVVAQGLTFEATCDVKGKTEQRSALVLFPSPVQDESMLKRVLVAMAGVSGKIKNTADIAKLKFGEDCSVPADLLFNDVPHPAWVRSYIYESVSNAVREVVNEKDYDKLKTENINKSRMQIKVNFPEVNPAFDTYRLGTVLEMVRHITLALTVEEGKRVRICVQQPLGEGIFLGLPLSLSSMRPILDRMDWGGALSDEEKVRVSDVEKPRKEALIRLGCVGPGEIADDDDVIIIIAPQNVIGGMLIDMLDEMVKAAKGKPVIIINPSLGDRPSSNNVMQIRGRSERKAIENSFSDIYVMRLLYPSSGGYMFPIKGLVLKKNYNDLYCVYSKDIIQGKEEYTVVAAFPSHPPPSNDVISSVFTDRNK